MIKTIVVLLLVSGNAMALSCSALFDRGTTEYLDCLESNQRNQQAQARVDAMANQIAADDRAQQANATVEDQALIHPHTMQMPSMNGNQY